MPEKNTPNNKDIHERLSGLVISNRYEIIKKIASGGMADVYLGQDLKLNRKIAVKILHQSYAENKNFIARFKREAQILARLNNPGIVTVYDWGEFDSMYFIAMEYVTGESLKNIIDKRGALEPGLAAKYSVKICLALESAHSNGLIHRDIKPQNIMITDKGDVKVTDFGIAKSIADDVTKTLSVVGTAHYISPEQAQGKLLDHRTDIYSLGVLMYEMLTADLPFRGGGSIDISLRHISEKPQLPSNILPGIPADLEKIIMKCLEKDPAERFQTVSDLEIDLMNYIEGRPLKIVTDQKNGRRRKKIPSDYSEAGQYGEILAGLNKRNRIIVTVLAVLSIVSLTLFSVFLSLFITANNRYSQLINSPTIIRVPPIENIDASSAEAILSTTGLNMIIMESYFSDNVPKDHIIEQFPEADSEVNINSNVEVTVSLGPESIVATIPNLIGLDINEATSAVEDNGFRIGRVSEEHSRTAEAGIIILQDPLYGRSGQPGSEIDLVISSGEELISVPNLTGYDHVYVRTNLESLGLKVITEKKSNTDYEPGTVIDIFPPPGTAVGKDTIVRLTISTLEELIIVPDVVSMSLQQAEEALAPLNIRYEINYIDVDYSIQKNSVISQYPEAGSQIFPGGSIILFVGQ